MKKTLPLLLAAVMVLTCMSGMVFATEVGETVTVTFSIAQNPGFATFGAQIGYNTEALELIAINKGELFQAGLFSSNIANGKVAYVNTANVTATGVLFTATFTVKEGAEPGYYNVTATLDLSTTTNADYESVAFAIIGGTVEVTCDHNWIEGAVTRQPTCTEPGERD